MDLNPDHRALERKKDEVLSIATEATLGLGVNSPELAKQIIRVLATFSPPLEPPAVMELITFRSMGRGGGISRKPGNIYLNLGKLLTVGPDAFLAAGAIATASPWLYGLIGLHVWNKLWAGAKADLSEVEACIVFVLWTNRTRNRKFSEEDAYKLVNDARNKEGLATLKREEFDRGVTKLTKIDAIELEEGTIWLREWVRVTYT